MGGHLAVAIDALPRGLEIRLLGVVDIDVLDPAFAPGVGNPEPDGLSTDELLTLVDASMEKNTVGFDLVEVSPQLDSGQTAAVGVKVIFEAIAALSTRSHDT